MDENTRNENRLMVMDDDTDVGAFFGQVGEDLGFEVRVVSDPTQFAVNVLEESQQEVSAVFATRDEDKFEKAAYTRGELGLPLLEGALATIECNVTHRLPGGDHTVFVGEIANAAAREGKPLLYFRGAYHRLAG